jgi:hypothetical protein
LLSEYSGIRLRETVRQDAGKSIGIICWRSTRKRYLYFEINQLVAEYLKDAKGED